MKRKLHPLRRHGRRHISAADRRAYRESGYFGDFKGRHTDTNPFPPFPKALIRGRRTTLGALLRAGYPMASLDDHADWTAAHTWLKENCWNAYGKTYIWFGGTFVFQHPEHHAAFCKQFACADGYKPMFAFEVRA